MRIILVHDWSATSNKNSLYVRGIEWAGQGLYEGYNFYPRVMKTPYKTKLLHSTPVNTKSPLQSHNPKVVGSSPAPATKQ